MAINELSEEVCADHLKQQMLSLSPAILRPSSLTSDRETLDLDGQIVIGKNHSRLLLGGDWRRLRRRMRKKASSCSSSSLARESHSGEGKERERGEGEGKSRLLTPTKTK